MADHANFRISGLTQRIPQLQDKLNNLREEDITSKTYTTELILTNVKSINEEYVLRDIVIKDNSQWEEIIRDLFPEALFVENYALVRMHIDHVLKDKVVGIWNSDSSEGHIFI